MRLFAGETLPACAVESETEALKSGWMTAPRAGSEQRPMRLPQHGLWTAFHRFVPNGEQGALPNCTVLG
jgi:hypothetical protein